MHARLLISHCDWRQREPGRHSDRATLFLTDVWSPANSYTEASTYSSRSRRASERSSWPAEGCRPTQSDCPTPAALKRVIERTAAAARNYRRDTHSGNLYERKKTCTRKRVRRVRFLCKSTCSFLSVCCCPKPKPEVVWRDSMWQIRICCGSISILLNDRALHWTPHLLYNYIIRLLCYVRCSVKCTIIERTEKCVCIADFALSLYGSWASCYFSIQIFIHFQHVSDIPLCSKITGLICSRPSLKFKLAKPIL